MTEVNKKLTTTIIWQNIYYINGKTWRLKLLQHIYECFKHHKPCWQQFIENIISNKRLKYIEWLRIHYIFPNGHEDWLNEKQRIIIRYKCHASLKRKWYLSICIIPHMLYAFPSLNFLQTGRPWIYSISSPLIYVFSWHDREDHIALVMVPNMENDINIHICTR